MPKTNFLKSCGLAVSVLAFSTVPVLAGFEWVAPPSSAMIPSALPMSAPPIVVSSPLNASEVISPVVITGNSGNYVSSAPSSMASAMVAVPVTTPVQGFAKDIPLALALRQIVPAGVSFSIDQNVDADRIVSYRGGRAWRETLDELLAPIGLVALNQGSNVLIASANGAQQLRAGGAAQAAMPYNPAPSIPLPAVAPTNLYPGIASPVVARQGHGVVVDAINAPYPIAASAVMPGAPISISPAPLAAVNNASAVVATPASSSAPVPMSGVSMVPVSSAPTNTVMSDYRPPVAVGNTISDYRAPVSVPNNIVEYRAPVAPANLVNDYRASAPVLSNVNDYRASTPSFSIAAPDGWTAQRGDTLRHVLSDWCKKSGVELQWLAEYDYPMEASTSFSGSFEDAVRGLLAGFENAQPQPVAQLHANAGANQKVLVLQARGNSYSN